MTIEQLIIEVINEGGAIVRARDCTPMEVEGAKATGRYAENQDGISFIRRHQEWLVFKTAKEELRISGETDIEAHYRIAMKAFAGGGHA